MFQVHSLGALSLLIWYGLYLHLSSYVLVLTTLFLIAATILIGVWTSNVMEKYWGEDPRAVVIEGGTSFL